MPRRALLLTAALAVGAVAAQPAAEPAAIELPGRDWQVMHCGFARGVLYLSYAEAGRPHVVPAFPTAPVLQVCARAGHPVAASAPVRTPLAMAPITIGPALPAAAAPPTPGAAAAPRATLPSISVQAMGGLITVDGRNDGDVAQRCTVQFEWLAGSDTLTQRGSAPVTLAPGQAGRVASVGVPADARLVGSPRWTCSAAR